ncbi:MAG: AAA family ATPase [Propionibacteriaceae bacterium]|jgi:DNA helicase IV|nr:AAA family ATPase [Propionibacteriaceae bacterium]
MGQKKRSTPLERELAIEQAHVDLVYHYLADATANARTAAQRGQSIYLSDRESRIREEDFTSLFERDAFAFQAAKRLSVLESEHEGLVFGRLDLADQEIRYIGRIGVRDEEYEPLVIDWRAKAAEPFYRATGTHPMGVARRRVLRTRRDVVIGIEDDLLDAKAGAGLTIVGEGALLAAITRSRGTQMRDIVATIQAEQDEAIRADYSGMTIISGGPGTGKTVVALHRAAYLLYSNRRRFENGGILVVGPTARFLNYIERVLPSLGEDSVTLRAIGQVAQDVIGLESTRQDDREAATIKGSLRMVALLKRLVSLPLMDEAASQLRVTVKGTVLTLDVAELSRIRRDVLTRMPANVGRAAAEAAVLEALYVKLPPELDVPVPQFEDLVTSSASYRMFFQSWWPMLTPTQVLARLQEPKVVTQVGRDLLDVDEQRILIESFAAPDWSVADTALLDELAELLGPVIDEDAEPADLVFLPVDSEVSELVTTADLLTDKRDIDPDEPPQRTYAHVLVDEAQDLSPMQWRMLRRRGPQASWTIVGDPAQSSWSDPLESQKVLAELGGSAPRRSFKLTKNYRSPAEVFNLARTLIISSFPDADLPEAVRTTGIEPELLVTPEADLGDAVSAQLARMRDAVEGTIGVIVPPSRWYEVEKALPGIDTDPRATMVTPLDSKGLEFDAVIVVSPDEITENTAAGIRLLYVCLTRPTQRLVTLDLNTPGSWR